MCLNENADVKAAARTGESRKLLVNDLIKYCEIEAASSFEKKRTVGF
ncbi:MAG: hypothetical protein JW870_07250 [Candidatus Delongbacteria bacterium]|nr:hypothetical protein [Candidatus Delongbacteria bacterium]